MSKCRFCEAPVEINQRTGRPKMYCSKKCANAWHHHKGAKRYIKKNKDWGTRGERDRLEKLKKAKIREEKNAWIDQNCISKADLASLLDVSEATLYNRMKALGLKSHKKIIPAEKNHKTFTFIEKKHIELIKNYKGKSYKAEPPVGYMSKADAASFLGVTEISIVTKLQRIKEKTGTYPVKREYGAEVLNGQTALRCFYNIEDVKKVKEMSTKPEYNCKKCKKAFQTWRKRDFCSQECKYGFSKEQKLKKIEEQGLIGNKKAKDLIGCSSGWSKLIEKQVKIGGRHYIRKSDIPNLRQEYKLFLEKEKKDTVIRRKDDWQHWRARENKLLEGFPSKVKRWEKKWGKNSPRIDKLLDAIDINHSYHGIMEVTGRVTHLTCNTCKENLPFWEFYFSCRSGASGRNISGCRSCDAKKRKGRRNAALAKAKRQKNYAGRIRTQVATSVKRHIAKITGEYSSIGTPEVWAWIEEHLGYTHNDLVKHIESQFTDKMHWQNQKTPRKPGEWGWHLDHIVPHSSFKYDSLDHPDFAPCWALKNLRPLEAVMNMQRGNKKLYQSYAASFRTGLKKATKGEVYTRGVWKHLDYSNLDAKKNIEKKFAAFSGFEWANWGEKWQIDHINPVAHLAYTSPDCKNFKKCWNLTNLSPIPRETNASKGSKWEDKLWFHNY